MDIKTGDKVRKGNGRTIWIVVWAKEYTAQITTGRRTTIEWLRSLTKVEG